MMLLGIPSKGRLMESTLELFSRAGHAISRDEAARGYRGVIAGVKDIEVAFLSAAEIALQLRSGKIALGVTGEDLFRETVPPTDESCTVMLRLGFGPADVVVAVPQCWLDVAAMSDLDEVAEQFYATHGRRLRVATKYAHLTRRFFAEHGVAGYRVVDSAGATEGAPAAGTAELVVDITTTGNTLRANQLKILDDGLILKSEAVLVARTGSSVAPSVKQLVASLESARIVPQL